MPITIVTRREQFNAAHRLYRPEFTDAENFEVFGKCSNPNWHGHNYTLWVSVKGEVSPETGFTVDLKYLSKIIRDNVIELLDHKNINVEVEFMHGVIPTTENLVVKIWQVLDTLVRQLDVELYCVRLQETDNNEALYYGE